MSQVKSLASFINSRLILITVLTALFASILSAFYTLAEFNFAIKPELLKKANVVAQLVHDDVELATDAGVPLDQIRGMDAYLADALSKYPELNFIGISEGKESQLGQVLYQAGTLDDVDIERTQQFESTSTQYLNSSITERVSIAIKELPSLFSMPFTDSSVKSDVFRLAINDHQGQIGSVIVGLDATYIQSQLLDIFFDIAIVLIAVLLVCFEVVMVVVMVYISGPLEESESILKRQIKGDFSVNDQTSERGAIGTFSNKLNHDSRQLQTKFTSLFNYLSNQKSNSNHEADSLKQHLKRISEKFNLQRKLQVRKGDIVDARIPLFVFSFGEELQKSFMPLYVAEYYEPNSWISQGVMLGLPISVFMFVIAAFTPFAAKLVDRFGQKRLFLFGLIPAIAGYLGCAFATNSMDIVISRGITALGYAVITISCQSYIAAVVTSENRAKGMAIFVGVLMTATMCGTALGGIIADRVGYQPVFLLSAVLAALAGMLAWRMFSAEIETTNRSVAKKKGGLLLLAKNIRFVAVVLCCAIPAKIVLTGFLYFLVPLYLVSLDASQSEIGRIMMIYSLVIIPLSPIASGIADKTQKTRELIVLGTVLSGVILLSLYGEASLFKILLAVTLMGVAHSILKAPLIACALEASEATPEVGRTEVLGILRTAERVGSVFGPIIVASLLAFGNYGFAMAVVGAGIIVSGLLMLFFLKAPSSQVSQEAKV
ncbi:MFS transporter [Photobacterium rosenbergii]|uniref:MFS transporter n=1 Tax=Photobacterium rosenbergii TaxID=294936 RepID=UPI001C99CA3C|nr:MFS transporter [Photobacterium rosenbergii]MBY5947690.1 MFS transporter [Photobacterium rosenbergii]